MPWAKIDYTELRFEPSRAFPAGYTSHRPYVPVTLSWGGEEISCYAVLDTGADGCTFPLAYANRLGLDPAKMVMERTNGVTGSGKVYYADVDIEIALNETKGEDARRAVLEVQTRVGFTSGLNAFGFGALGQMGFFERYPVTFNRPDGTFTIYFNK